MDVLAGAQIALDLLSASYLLVQGPPGSGKTYCSGRAIATLLAGGKRIGVASHSHKAINNLLKAVEQAAVERGLRFRGIKKSPLEEQFLSGCGLVEDTLGNDVACSAEFALVAGTAWLFARDELDQALDYLFVDEAGQVSLANLVAMGVSAKNIVLVGDQMHSPSRPGHSSQRVRHVGDEHLLADHATVPAIAAYSCGDPADAPGCLPVHLRAVYDGWLDSEPKTTRQRLVLDPSADPGALTATGMRFVGVEQRGARRSRRER